MCPSVLVKKFKPLSMLVPVKEALVSIKWEYFLCRLLLCFRIHHNHLNSSKLNSIKMLIVLIKQRYTLLLKKPECSGFGYLRATMLSPTHAHIYQQIYKWRNTHCSSLCPCWMEAEHGGIKINLLPHTQCFFLLPLPILKLVCQSLLKCACVEVPSLCLWQCIFKHQL